MTRSSSFYAGLALTAGATLALEILQVRILSVVSWYHLAFFVISIAMFGMTAGALFVFARPAFFAPEVVPRRIAQFALAGALSVLLSYLDQITLATAVVFSAATPVVFLRLALTVSVPFFFSGVVVTLALLRSGLPVARAYAADLFGASAGCLAVLGLLSRLDGAGSVFAIGGLFAGGAFCFAHWSGAHGLQRPAALAVVFLGVLALAESRTLSGFDPIVVKGRVEQREAVAFERWNSFSRVSGRPVEVVPANAALWAPSRAMPDAPTQVARLTIDGEASTTVFPMGGDPRNVAYLGLDATASAYWLRRGSVAVIGVGGGKDVTTALLFGNRPILGVEINPAFLEALAGPYRDFAGIARRPEIRLVNDEARSYMARSTESFDLLQMSLVDTWAATGAGAFTLSENGLYTVEAWRIFLSRLTPTGIFTVSRWHAPDNPDETARLIGLASATLFSFGVTRPADHLALVVNGPSATLIMGRSPLTPGDVSRLQQHCERLGFELALAPGQPPQAPWLRRILEAGSRDQIEEIARAAPLDLSPPTDDRPFFFNLLRPSKLWQIRAYARPGFGGMIFGNLVATITLSIIVLVTLGLATAVALVPGRFAPPGSRPPAGALAYFAMIGAGFMLVEIAFLQRLSVFLGHPVYALSIVLFSLILFTGAGSYLSPWLRLHVGGRLAAYGPLAAAVLVALWLVLARVTGALEGQRLLVRAAVAVALLAPAGLLMGQAFPAGLARFGSSAQATPWLWAVNGAAGVAASTLAVAISMAWGTTVTALLGGALYAALPLTILRPAVANEDRIAAA